jgi:hypothetical protein
LLHPAKTLTAEDALDAEEKRKFPEKNMPCSHFFFFWIPKAHFVFPLSVLRVLCG